MLIIFNAVLLLPFQSYLLFISFESPPAAALALLCFSIWSTLHFKALEIAALSFWKLLPVNTHIPLHFLLYEKRYYSKLHYVRFLLCINIPKHIPYYMWICVEDDTQCIWFGPIWIVSRREQINHHVSIFTKGMGPLYLKYIIHWLNSQIPREQNGTMVKGWLESHLCAHEDMHVILKSL